ncbi:epoxyqueuosine reductase [Lachnospiraceae bacterium OttesenSCG-928-E19]|nr:epoxyqueuosine reductase [Lachnospiraceae bacterium OttesenSCG-928-E19]
MELTKELKELLQEKGAGLVGIGHMEGIKNCVFETGVSVAIPLPKNIVMDLREAPTKEYYEMYYSLNSRLNKIVTEGERFLKSKGFEAYAQVTERVEINEKYISKLPHKTVATRSGMGWIGKNGLLVTKPYGSAIRISSLLTNAPLECGEPVEKSMCGACMICVKNCPAQALTGALWTAGMERDELVDVNKCYKKQREIMKKSTGIETDLCGKCFAVCAYTRKYVSA